MTVSQSDPKAPTAPALPDSARLPHAPYHQVLGGQPALVTGANSGIGKGPWRWVWPAPGRMSR